MRRFLTTFDWLTLIPFDAEHAFVAAKLEATLRQRSDVNQDRINALAGDLLIAAVAKERNAAVVTENVRDFSLFEDSPVDTYR